MTLDNKTLAKSVTAPSTQPAPEPAFRSHTHPDGLLHVVKGRSYIEPVTGRSPPLSLQQGINGLVGKGNVYKGDIEYLKKNLGLVMATSDGVMSSQRLVLTSKVLGWLHEKIPMLEPENGESEAETSSTTSSRRPPMPDSLANPRLFPRKSYFANRRKQGQCYSMMKEAECQKRLFYADLSRARRLSTKTKFIRRRQETRLAEKSQEFDLYEEKDGALLEAVKKYMDGVRKQSHLLAVLRARSFCSRKSNLRLSETDTMDLAEPSREGSVYHEEHPASNPHGF